MGTPEEMAREMETVCDDTMLALTERRVHEGALAAATAILGAVRAREAPAFADLLLARFNEITGAYRDLALLGLGAGPAQIEAAVSRFLAAATVGVSAGMVEALRFGVRGPERGSTQ